MEQIEIILRTTDTIGKVTEQLLAKFNTEKPVISRDKVLQYSGLRIDPDKHQTCVLGEWPRLPFRDDTKTQIQDYSSTRYSGCQMRI